MTLDDVDHYTPEQKEKIAASYAPHEREARTKGVPTLGSGRIFPVAEEMLTIDHREFPSHWPRIGGMDFGWDHPFAAGEVGLGWHAGFRFWERWFPIRRATTLVEAGGGGD